MSGITQAAKGAQSSRGSGGADPNPPALGKPLRPYQHEAFAAICRTLGIGGGEPEHRRAVAVIPTGGGKTRIASEVIRTELQHGGRALFMAHREELLEQTVADLAECGVHAAIEQGARTARGVRCVVASVQTLSRPARLATFARDEFSLLVPDECHHAPAKSWNAVLQYFVEARALGLTATPDRADGTPLDTTFGTVAYRIEIRDLIQQGYLVPVTARRVVVDAVDLREVRGSGGDFVQSALAEVMEQQRAIQGVVVPHHDHASDRRTAVFAASVAHAQMLADAINRQRAGAACVVHGELDKDLRRTYLADYARGRYQFVCNVDVLTEGWNNPPTSCIAMVRPTKSRARYVQAAGRGLRLSPETGKRDCLILDFTGTAGKHALIGPADCLSSDRLPDDLRAEIERLLATAALDVDRAVTEAERNVGDQRAALRVSAMVRWHAEQIDPFIGSPRNIALPDRPAAWAREPASEAALTELERLTTDSKGVVHLPREKLPSGFGRADAWRLISVLRARDKDGLCTIAQAKRLRGFVDTITLSKVDAGRLMRAGNQSGWPDGVRAEVAAMRSERSRAS